MRLTLVSQEYPPETGYGGIGTQNHAKAHGLAAMGHDVHVISHSTDGDTHEYADGLVHVTRIPGVDNELPLATEEARWITYSAQVATAIARLHTRSPLDLVEFADWGSEGCVHLLNQADWNHIPSVIHLHGPIVMFAHAIGWPDPESPFYAIARRMEETCVRRADAVFSSSRCSAEWCERFHGLHAQQVPVIHTGIDTHHFYRLDVPKSEDPTIVFVGKIEQNKGVELLVKAACQLAHRIPRLQVRLLGRGNPDVATELKRQAEEAGCPELLDLVGYVDQSELPRYLSTSHVFAAPSEYEGGPGFVYLESDRDSVREAPDARRLPTAPDGQLGHVRLENVTFGYDADRPVLCDVSLEARPGEVVAIVGPTGVGKSTLVSLIARLYDPWSGSVSFDGMDLRKVQLQDLRNNISIVMQEPFLFPMSVADNIAYGRPSASVDQIYAAARAANADDFIQELPHGYDTVIGERGITLSGGEKQRISIARALLKDAPVIILDEPTSALDALTESSLIQAMDRLIQGRTTFIIAHRLSTVRKADRIVVLKDGCVLEIGSHDELLATGGAYSDICRLSAEHVGRPSSA